MNDQEWTTYHSSDGFTCLQNDDRRQRIDSRPFNASLQKRDKEKLTSHDGSGVPIVDHIEPSIVFVPFNFGKDYQQIGPYYETSATNKSNIANHLQPWPEIRSRVLRKQKLLTNLPSRKPYGTFLPLSGTI